MNICKWLVVFLAFFLLTSCATDKIAGGNTSETGDVVAGIIFHADGVTRAEGVKVYFLQRNFLPGMDSLMLFADSTLTDTDGSFVFDSVDSGLYVITAVDTGSLGVRISDIHVENDSIELPPVSLQTNGSITGTLHLIDPATPIAIKIYGLTRTFDPNPDGSFLLDSLPAGRYEIRFETPDMAVEFLDSMAVTVTSGTVTQMDTVMVPVLRSFLTKGEIWGIFADSGMLQLRVRGAEANPSTFYLYDISDAGLPVKLGSYHPVTGWGTIVSENGFTSLSGFGSLDIRNPGAITVIDNNPTGKYYEFLDGNTLFGPSSSIGLRVCTVDFAGDTFSIVDRKFLGGFNGLYDVAAKDGYAYGITNLGCQVIDIRDPANPALADSILFINIVDQISPDSISDYPFSPRSQIEIRGDNLYVYLCGWTKSNDLNTSIETGYTAELRVFNLNTDPIRPLQISSTPIPSIKSAGGTNQPTFSLNSSHAFILEINVSEPNYGNRIRLVDIRDPYAMKSGPVYAFSVSTHWTIYTWERYLFVGTGEGLMILEVGN